MNLWTKLKSWKRHAWVYSALAPYVIEYLTGKITWQVAAILSTGSILFGLNVIGKDDIARIQASK